LHMLNFANWQKGLVRRTVPGGWQNSDEDQPSNDSELPFGAEAHYHYGIVVLRSRELVVDLCFYSPLAVSLSSLVF